MNDNNDKRKSWVFLNEQEKEKHEAIRLALTYHIPVPILEELHEEYRLKKVQNSGLIRKRPVKRFKTSKSEKQAKNKERIFRDDGFEDFVQTLVYKNHPWENVKKKQKNEYNNIY